MIKPPYVDPLDMSEVLADINAPYKEDNFTDGNETDADRIKNLVEAVAQAEAAALLNYQALTLLMSICKQRGFDPFPNESMPLSKPVSDMTPQELIMRNGEVTIRVNKFGRVNNKDKIKPPTREQLDEMYETRTRSNGPAMSAFMNMLINDEKTLTFEQIASLVKAEERSQS